MRKHALKRLKLSVFQDGIRENLVPPHLARAKRARDVANAAEAYFTACCLNDPDFERRILTRVGDNVVPWVRQDIKRWERHRDIPDNVVPFQSLEDLRLQREGRRAKRRVVTRHLNTMTLDERRAATRAATVQRLSEYQKLEQVRQAADAKKKEEKARLDALFPPAVSAVELKMMEWQRKPKATVRKREKWIAGPNGPYLPPALSPDDLSDLL